MFSIFGDLDKCCITGSTYKDIHHCFCGANRHKCEKYGYVIPIHKKLHPNGVEFDKDFCKQITGKDRVELNNWIRAECQKDYESKHGTREDFINEFGRNYL